MDVHPTKNGINRYWPIPNWRLVFSPALVGLTMLMKIRRTATNGTNSTLLYTRYVSSKCELLLQCPMDFCLVLLVSALKNPHNGWCGSMCRIHIGGGMVTMFGMFARRMAMSPFFIASNLTMAPIYIYITIYHTGIVALNIHHYNIL